MYRLHTLFFFALAFLSGCSASSQFSTRDVVEIRNDSYAGLTIYSGISHHDVFSESPLGGISYNHFIRSWKHEGGIKHQAYVETMYVGDWKFFRMAMFEGGVEADFVDINKDVVTCTGYGICTHKEIFGVEIPDDMLRSNPNGISFKVYAQSGTELVINILPEQISAQLAALGQ